VTSVNKIPVIEIFGPTIQGEGMVIGQKTMFVRTAGCDYACAWCDSAFTWDGSGKDDIRLLTPEEVWDELKTLGQSNFSHVTISGGNPALLKGIGPLVDLLHEHNIVVALETQGSRWQDWMLHIDELTLSPKPPSSRMETDWKTLDKIIGRLSEEGKGQSSLKIVVFDEKDYEYAVTVHKRYPHLPFYVQAGNSWVNDNNDDGLLLHRLVNRYEWLISRVMNDERMTRVRILPQLHTYVWGNKRGV
jgi:7-carboxy-7-deazaguanine synthase